MLNKLQAMTVDAAIRPGELSRLLHTSRTATSRWVNGHVEPTRYLQPRIEKLFDAVSQALQAGELPLEASLSRDERMAALNKILWKYLAPKS